jgi:hypothetical protein
LFLFLLGSGTARDNLVVIVGVRVPVIIVTDKFRVRAAAVKGWELAQSGCDGPIRIRGGGGGG